MRLFGRSLNNHTDESLMRMIRDGSELAIETIYHRYSQPLLRYFLRMLWQDRKKAEDFMQDLFVKILESPGKFNDQQKFSTWIYSIAHNMCKNEYRKHHIRNGHRLQLHQTELQPESIVSQIDQQSFQKTLDKALEEEGEEMKTMFVLRYELDMDILEISSVLQCPEGTIKSRLFYLKRKLATQLNYFKPVLEQ